jgi:hypothetical protein
METKFRVAVKKHKSETSIVSLRLPVDLIETIDNTCKITGQSRNEFIIQSLDFIFDNLVIDGLDGGSGKK